jgi:hypothetical protein
MIKLLLALILTLPIPPTAAPCRVIAAPVGVLRITIPARQTVGDIYATQPVSATNGLVTDTVTLTRPFLAGWPPRPILMSSAHPYTVYVCRSGFAPAVYYLP